MKLSFFLRQPLWSLVTVLAFSLAAGIAFVHGHDDHNHHRQDHRHHGAHVHGAADLTLVLEGEALWLELTLPGVDAVGFERPPADEDERKKLRQVVATLEDISQLIHVSVEAQCELREASVDASRFEDAGSGHAELMAGYRFDCARPQALREISLPLLDIFESLEQVRLQWIIEERQGSVRIAATDSVIFN